MTLWSKERKDMIQPPHEVLQHGALPGALPPHHRDLRQVQVAALADGAEGVLQLVDEGDEVFHSPIPHDGRPDEGSAPSDKTRAAAFPANPKVSPTAPQPPTEAFGFFCLKRKTTRLVSKICSGVFF